MEIGWARGEHRTVDKYCAVRGFGDNVVECTGHTETRAAEKSRQEVCCAVFNRSGTGE